MHPSDYNRLDYGKDMHTIICCYVTCNCQSRLSVHARLDEYVTALLWKPHTTPFWHQCLSWLGPPLPWGVLIRPQILLRVLKKNWGPTREGPLQFSLYLLIKIGSFVSFWEVLYMNNIVWYLPVSVWLTSLSMIISRCIHVVANDISFFLMIE